MLTSKQVRSILTPQKAGFATAGPYPLTHTLSPYTGCAFGNTACGQYYYAQFLPNRSYAAEGAAWGSLVQAKENAPQLLDQTLGAMRPATAPEAGARPVAPRAPVKSSARRLQSTL